MLAAVGNKPEVLMTLLNHEADVNAKKENGWTPLMLAASDNPNLEALKVLLKAGADVNAKEEYGWTPLMLAARYNTNPEVLTVLLDAGTNAKAKNDEGQTALDYASVNEKFKGTRVLRLLEEKTGLFSEERGKRATEELLDTVGKVDSEKVNQLIHAGANVNARNKNGWTPLMIAAWKNPSPKILTALLSHGADVHAKSGDGWTPLMLVARYNTNPEALKVLLKAGADVNAKKENGWTPRSEEHNV